MKLFLFLFLLNILNAYTAETRVNLLKSKGSKHIVTIEDNLGVEQNGKISIKDSKNNSVDFTILKIDKTGKKLLISGPNNISLADMCASGCSGSIGDDFEEDFGGGFDRKPASEEMISQKPEKKEPVLLKKSFLSFNAGLSNTISSTVGSLSQEDFFDLVLDFSFEHDLMQKSMGPMHWSLSLGGGLDIGFYQGSDFYAAIDPLVVMMPNFMFNFNFIPTRMIRLFIGPNLNYALFSNREYTFGGSSYVEERSGSLGFGIQTGVNFVFGGFLLQLKYQSMSASYSLNVMEDNISGIPSDVDSTISILSLGLGAAF